MRAFSNSRRWQDFLAAIHGSVPTLTVSYPNVLEALRKSGAWFSEAAADVRTHCSVIPLETPPT